MRKLKLLFMSCMVAMAANAADFTDGGKYFLKNTASNMYWGAGNSWGTQATLVEHPEYVYLHAQNDGQYTIESQVSNGGNNKYFGGNYMDSDNPWWLTFTQNAEGKYTIAAGTNYFGYDGATTVLGKNLDATSANVLWEVYSEAEMRTLLEAATVDAPVDATWLMLNPNFGRNNRWGQNLSTNNDQVKNADLGGAWTFDASNKNVAGDVTNYCVESWHATFTMSQALTNVPNGTYRMTAQGFYRQDGSDNDNLPYFYANDEKQTFPLKTGTENSMSDASSSFSIGSYTIEPIWVYVTDGNLTVGAKNETNTALWCIWDNFALTYYGNVTIVEAKLAAFVNAYKDALAAAQAYQSTDMFDEDKAALNTAISENTLDLTGDVTEEQLTTATTNLNAAADAAATAALKYSTYTNANTLINGGENVDLTSLIVNPSFEQSTNGWTVVGGLGPQSNDSFGKTGTYYLEYWQPNGTKSVLQTVGYLPAGLYKMTVRVKARGVTSAKVFAGGIDQAVTVGDDEIEYTVSFALDEKTDALIGLEVVGTGAGNSWIALDNFRLTYVGALPDELTAVTGAMNAEVAAAQTAAINAYESNKTVANYNAAQAAIVAAQTSVAAYLPLGTAITKIDAALAAATTATASDADYQTVKTAYNDGTIADADIRTNVKAAYDAVIPVIKSQTAANADFTLAIQNQSFEYGDLTGWTVTASSDTGVRETANATYAATGSDGEYLFNTYWRGNPITQTVNGLPNGQYTMTVGVASDGATIYLIANGNHNEGTETGGNYPSKDVLQEASITFIVEDGTATIGVVGGDDGTAGEHKAYREDGYWWYKADNFRLVKNRDLTPVYAVVGSKKGDDTDKAIFSGAWDANATTDFMTLTDGVYTKTFAVQKLDAQTIAYKVIKKNDAESTNAVWYGNGEDNMELSVPVKGQYDITFTFTEGETPVITGVAVKTAEAVTISAAGWATTVTNSPLNFANQSDVEAYTATVDGVVSLTKVNDVQAETGLVLKGAEGTYYLPVIESSETEKGDLMFSSTLTYDTWQPTDGTVNTFYGLTINDQQEAQFVKLNNGTIQPQKAFLMINSPAEGARTLKVVFAGEATGIDAIAAENGAESIYNINGQRVNVPAKGLYIVNGKKVVLK